jgi:ribosomal protein S18 acetylase RimI-like enzyme
MRKLMTVAVRAATVDDAAAIAGLHVRSWQQGYAGIMPTDVLTQLDTGAWTQRRRQAIESRRSTMLVATEAGTGAVAGFAEAGRARRSQDWNDMHPTEGEVYAIYVDPPRWGSGAGRALMDASVAALKAVGRAPVRLWVLDANDRARRFYERYGFVLDGERSSYPVARPDGSTTLLDEVRYVFHATG